MAMRVLRSKYLTQRRRAAASLLPAAAAASAMLLLLVVLCCGAGKAARLTPQLTAPEAAAVFDKAADEGFPQLYMAAGFEIDSDNRGPGGGMAVLAAGEGDDTLCGEIDDGTSGLGGDDNMADTSGLRGVSSFATGTGGQRRDLLDYYYHYEKKGGG